MSSSEVVDLVAIITPKPGKLDRVIELLTSLAQFVLENEPLTLRYQIQTPIKSQDGSEEIIMVEQYKDLAAFEHHCNLEGFKELGQKIAEEDLLAKPFVIMPLKVIAGFASR